MGDNDMMQKKVTYRLGELFCGPGGLGCAAKDTIVSDGEQSFGISHAWATDLDKDACATYRRNLVPNDPGRVICADIRTLDLGRLRDISEVDALSFGFPCNDFSLVGQQ